MFQRMRSKKALLWNFQAVAINFANKNITNEKTFTEFLQTKILSFFKLEWPKHLVTLG